MHTPDQLRQWQRKAADILATHDYQLLGAQPGSGKTITTLSAMVQQPRRTILVAPAIILDSVWPLEAKAWKHTQQLTFDFAHRHSGANRTEIWFTGFADLVTCTPDTLIKFASEVEHRGQMPVRRMVVDESQFFKNATAARTAALHVLAEHVPTWLLSGTPSPNGPIDCWSPGRIVSKGGEFWQ